MRHPVSDALRRTVFERAFGVCEYCLVHQNDVYYGCEVDHVVSVKHGGSSVPENLAFACFHCNRHKGSDLGSLIRRTGVLVRFYNPRTDAWTEHFRLVEARIEPLTAIAEVTVRVLEFNHPDRVAFRKILAEIGRYPSVEAMALIKS